jgi:hypothetical protein
LWFKEPFNDGPVNSKALAGDSCLHVAPDERSSQMALGERATEP